MVEYYFEVIKTRRKIISEAHRLITAQGLGANLETRVPGAMRVLRKLAVFDCSTEKSMVRGLFVKINRFVLFMEQNYLFSGGDTLFHQYQEAFREYRKILLSKVGLDVNAQFTPTGEPLMMAFKQIAIGYINPEQTIFGRLMFSLDLVGNVLYQIGGAPDNAFEFSINQVNWIKASDPVKKEYERHKISLKRAISLMSKNVESDIQGLLAEVNSLKN